MCIIRPVLADAPVSRWLLLIHQLPADPPYLRVKIGRRLDRLGAVALKGSVYVLPKSSAAMEDFQWVRREILEGGGEATVIEAALADGLSDESLEEKFRDKKDAEYAALIDESKQLLRKHLGSRKKKSKHFSEEDRFALAKEFERLQRQVESAGETDFFGAPSREVLDGILSEIREKLAPEPALDAGVGSREAFSGRVWVTRTGVHVDRIASAWLIKRFIDPKACFKFVPVKGYLPEPGELRFDMFEAEFSHEGDACTFEVLCARMALKEPGLKGVAEIVHDIDLKDEKFKRKETFGVASLIHGLCLRHRTDEARITHGSEIFEQLLAFFSRKQESPA